MVESVGGGELPLPLSHPPAPTGGGEHLGEVPALDEVSGKVPGGWAVDDHPNVPPWHAGCGLPVNEIWGSQESQERSGMVSWEHLGRGEEELPRGKAALSRPSSSHSQSQPQLLPLVPALRVFGGGGPSPSKGRSSCTQSLVIRLL